jgi:hypothetical protein
MLDTPCSEVAWSLLSTHSIRQLPFHFPSCALPCTITFQLESTADLLLAKFCTLNCVEIGGLGLTLHISWIMFDWAEFVLHNFDATLLYSCEYCTGCHTVKSPFSKSTFSTFGIKNDWWLAFIVQVFWHVTPCRWIGGFSTLCLIFKGQGVFLDPSNTEDEGIRFLRNVRNH